MMGAKPFIAGNKLTMADILLFAFLDFMKGVGQPLDPANKNLTAWFERMKARPSAAA
jgi:glutathione S-transferase